MSIRVCCIISLYHLKKIITGDKIIIFAHTLDKLLHGGKTQTRRVVKPDESFDTDRRAIVKGNKRTMYRVGKTYAVQPGRTRKAVARILITDIRKEAVSRITEADAIAEGYVSTDEFFASWHNIHGKNADLNREVWVMTFKLDSVDQTALDPFKQAQNQEQNSPAPVDSA